MKKPLNEEQLIDLGYDTLEAGDLKLVRRIARKLIKMNSEYGFCLMAYSYADEYKTKKALHVLNEGARLFPWSSSISTCRFGVICKISDRVVDEGQYLTALSLARELQTDGSCHGYLMECRIHRENDDLNKAVTCLERGLKACPGQYFIANDLGNVKLDLERPAEALAAFELALSCADLKGNAEAIATVKSGIVVSLNRLERFEEAFKVLESVPQLDGSWVVMKMTLMDRLERFDDIIDFGESWKRKSDETDTWTQVVMHTYLARAYRDVGNLVAAKENAKCALKYDPKDKMARQILKDSEKQIKLQSRL